MDADQRERALRLADELEAGVIPDANRDLDAAALLRELAAEPERVPLTEEVIAEITREASRGAATRRDGTTSIRIARAVERAHGIVGGGK